MKYQILIPIALLAVFSVGVTDAFAAPRLINYQGILTDDVGNPLSGTYDLTFYIYSGPTDLSVPLWVETQAGVSVVDGLFNVILGGVTPLSDSLFGASDQRWLTVAVADEGTMHPFMRITSVPWAFRAAIADSAVNGSGGGGPDGDWTIDGDDIYAAVSGQVGIGTTSPDGKVHVVNGSMQTTMGDHDYDLLVDSWSAVDGRYGSNASGFLGRREFVLNKNYYCGVYGTAEGGDAACGVKGQHSTTYNYGLLGADDFGVSGVYMDSGNYGHLGTPDAGVYGLNRNSGIGAHAGVMGENETSSNVGYLGGDFMGAYAKHGGTLNNVQMGTAAFALKAQAFSGRAAEFVGDVYMSNGRLSAVEIEITGGADLSERFEISNVLSNEDPRPGHVVSINPERPGQLMVSGEPYDRKVAGVISGAGGVRPGLLMGQDETAATGSEAVALSGRVYCWADATSGTIQPGDLLTTSDVPGHAMKVVDHERAQGAVIGKAMSNLDEGRGLVLVLVRPQ